MTATAALRTTLCAKERIFAAQDEHDFVVLNADNARAAAGRRPLRSPRSTGFPSSIRSRRAPGLKTATSSTAPRKDDAVEKIMPLSGIPLKGAHNVENVLAAVCAAAWPARPAEAIRHAVEELSGRRASAGVRRHRQRRRVLQRLQGHQRRRHRQGHRRLSNRGIHLILGGKDKNSDYTQLAPLLRERVRAVYTIGSAAAKIESQLRGVVSIHSCETLDNAVSAAATAARPGEVVLLAPACSSFDQFENYEQRGRVFKELVGERRGWKVWQSA